MKDYAVIVMSALAVGGMAHADTSIEQLQLVSESSAVAPVQGAIDLKNVFKKAGVQGARREDSVQDDTDTPIGSYPAEYTSGSYPSEYTSTSYPSEYTSTSYPGEYTTTSYPSEYTSTSYPAEYTSNSYPSEYTSTSYPAEYTSTSYPAEYTAGSQAVVGGAQAVQRARYEHLPVPQLQLERSAE